LGETEKNREMASTKLYRMIQSQIARQQSKNNKKSALNSQFICLLWNLTYPGGPKAGGLSRTFA